MTKTELPEVPIAIVHRPGQEPGVTMPLSAFLRLVALARENLNRTVEVQGGDDRVVHVAAEELPYPDLHPDLVMSDDLEAIIRELSESIAETLDPAASDEARELDEDLADRAAIEAARRSGEETVPHELVKRLLAGDHPVKVYREHRGLTQAALAERTGLSPIYISQIETGRRGGGTKTLKRIARTLDVDLDDLASWDEDTETPQDKAPTRAVKRTRAKPVSAAVSKRARPVATAAEPTKARNRSRRD